MIVGIAGLGLMGASLARALRRSRPDLDLMGVDSDPGVQRSAEAQGVVRGGDLRDADLVVLAVPIAALPGLLATLTDFRGVVTDLASTKVEVMAWAAAAGVDLVGGHPMCGSERSGFAASDPDLFRGSPWLLTRPDPLVLELIEAVGAHPVLMNPIRHDRLAAGASHLAYLLSVSYVLSLAEGDDWEGVTQVAGSGFRDLSRLAAGDPQLYAGILRSNRVAVLEALSRMEATLARLGADLASDDPGLVARLAAAKRARDGWAQHAGKG
ncbi:MAG: prephenate dehydrogenase [Candidatus Dormibacteraceae bacterium]